MSKNDIEIAVGEITLRPGTEKDLPQLAQVALAQGDHHDIDYFARCLVEQAKEARLFLVAALPDQRVIGYVQLIWRPIYAPFRALGIPEIQDLAVISEYRRQGLGERLVRHCEDLARAQKTAEIGIGVGLHSRFGAAQRLYVRMGYIPDGNGVVYDEDNPVNRGDLRPIDDLLTLKFVKAL